MSEHFSGALQENLLTLLCFSETSFRMVRDAVEPELFSSAPYRNIVERVASYIDQFNLPPKDHLADLLEDVLVRKDNTAKLYGDILDAAYGLRETINEKYVLSQLTVFVRQQRLKIGVLRASEYIQDGALEEAEAELSAISKFQLQVFSPGMTLEQALGSTVDPRIDVVDLGIREIDYWGLGPARGEVLLFIAPPKRGKTWWLVHVAKRALLARLNVLYITLEISERLIAQRFLQTFFSVTRRKARINVVRIETDNLGRLMKLQPDTLKNRLSFSDSGTIKALQSKLSHLHTKGNLLIKAFPTGSLTVAGLRGYLDSLERNTRFVPDMIVVDYPDLMKIDPKNLRHETGDIYKNLRGLMVERNVHGILASQSNRTGAGAKLVTDLHSAEDYSKIATADTVVTYTQTMAEREAGLARLFVSNSRVGDKDRFVVLISQAYQVGQFCLDSAAMTDTYMSHLEGLVGKPITDEKDDDGDQ